MTSRGGHFPQARRTDREEEHHLWFKESNVPKPAERSSLLEIQVVSSVFYGHGKKLGNIIQDTTIKKIQAIFTEPLKIF